MNKALLCVGHCCLDDIFQVLTYPDEDSTVGSNTKSNRCTEHSWERGGNASNNSTVLALLGADVEFLGTLARDHLLTFLLDNMDSYGIKHDNCPILDSYRVAVSSVICSLATGSRTIVHCNGGLPELTFDLFQDKVDLDNYCWIHFEGRNEVELQKMLVYVQDYQKRNAGESVGDEPNYKRKMLPISIEVEKQIESIGALMAYADVAFVGKDYAKMKGATNPSDAAIMFSKQLTKGTLVICPWGEQGAAFAIAGDSAIAATKVDASPPAKIVDSLGAGDTFNSAVIYALTKNYSVEASVRFGCRIAGAKLGFRGFKPIAQLPPLDS